LTGVPPGTNFTLKFAEVLSHPPLKVVTRGVEGPGAVKFDGSVYMGNLFWADPVRIEQRQQTETETAVRESSQRKPLEKTVRGKGLVK